MSPQLEAAASTVASFVLSLAAVRGMIAYTLRRGILDVPTDRSSHDAPVPRGGGLGMLSSVVAVTLVHLAQRGPASALLPIAAACALAAVGWLDDRGGLGVRVRFTVHLAAGVALAVFLFRLGEPWWLSAWWLFCAVSAINVVNFMDGIDGFVASQCAILCASLAALAPTGSLGFKLACILGAALLGFLCWNWPPARIFMGDVGSGTLGFLCVFVGALVMRDADVGLVRAFLPLVPMVLDSSWTILRRLRNGDRLTQAHRVHLYQRLANGGWTHRGVTTLYAAAAAVGGIVAVTRTTQWGFIAAAYLVGVFVAGMALDRTRPFVWTQR